MRGACVSDPERGRLDDDEKRHRQRERATRPPGNAPLAPPRAENLAPSNPHACYLAVRQAEQ